jgi:hypothetical protein
MTGDDDLREQIRTGRVRLGPGTTSMLIPFLVVPACCEEARQERCAGCGVMGATHGYWLQVYCVDCLARGFADDRGRKALRGVRR